MRSITTEAAFRPGQQDAGCVQEWGHGWPLSKGAGALDPVGIEASFLAFLTLHDCPGISLPVCDIFPPIAMLVVTSEDWGRHAREGRQTKRVRTLSARLASKLHR
jgi:hypothetical protein